MEKAIFGMVDVGQTGVYLQASGLVVLASMGRLELDRKIGHDCGRVQGVCVVEVRGNDVV